MPTTIRALALQGLPDLPPAAELVLDHEPPTRLTPPTFDGRVEPR